MKILWKRRRADVLAGLGVVGFVGFWLGVWGLADGVDARNPLEALAGAALLWGAAEVLRWLERDTGASHHD